MNERNFFAELKRRDVYKVAGAFRLALRWRIQRIGRAPSPMLQMNISALIPIFL
jgi:hypothetical protein